MRDGWIELSGTKPSMRQQERVNGEPFECALLAAFCQVLEPDSVLNGNDRSLRKVEFLSLIEQVIGGFGYAALIKIKAKVQAMYDRSIHRPLFGNLL